MNSLLHFIKPLKSIYDNLNEAVFVTDLSGKIAYLNNKAGSLFGYDQKNYHGAKCGFFPADFTFADMMTILGNLETTIKDIECKSAEGPIKMVMSSTLLRNEQNDPMGALILLRTNHVMQENEKNYFGQYIKLLQALKHRTTEWVTVTDVSSLTIPYCSSGIQNILGWPAESLTTGGYAFGLSLVYSKDAPAYLNTYMSELMLRSKEKFVHDHVPIVVIARHKHLDGSLKLIHSEMIILERDDEKNIKYLLTFSHDISNKISPGTTLSDNQIEELISGDILDLNVNSHKSSAGTVQLSSREKEILQLVKEGLSTKEIAARTGIGITTVSSYRKNLMRKLNARNTAELVKISYELNIT